MARFNQPGAFDNLRDLQRNGQRRIFRSKIHIGGDMGICMRPSLTNDIQLMPTVVGSITDSNKLASAMGMLVTGWAGGYLMVSGK